MADAIRSFPVRESTADCTIVGGRVSLISYRGLHLTLEEIEDLAAGVSQVIAELDMDITKAFGDEDDGFPDEYIPW